MLPLHQVKQLKTTRIMIRVWVLSALFADNDIDKNDMDVISVHSDLDEAIRTRNRCVDETKKDWLDEGLTEDDILEIRNVSAVILKTKDNSKRTEFALFGKYIDNEY